jgi:hypothetical protein
MVSVDCLTLKMKILQSLEGLQLFASQHGIMCQKGGMLSNTTTRISNLTIRLIPETEIIH